MNRAASERKIRLSLRSGTGLALLAGILVFANLVFSRVFTRFDWTADRRFALSSASRNLIRSLEDPVTVTFYRSPGLPQPYESQGRYVEDLLREYREASRGRLRFSIINPQGSQEALEGLRRAGIQAARFTELASDQYQVREGYMGLALRYQDKQETMPFINDTLNLEYDISSRIRAMTLKTKKTLLFVNNHNETAPYSLQQGPAARLFQEFHVEPTRISTAPLAEDPAALFILGPKSPLSPGELAALDGFLARGVPLVVTLNRRIVNPQNFFTYVQQTGLEPYLKHYGVDIGRDIVMDPVCQTLAMQTNQGSFLVRYIAYPIASVLNKQNLITKNLDSLGFPFVHPLSPTTPSTLRFTPLADSSKKSWIWPGFSNLDPQSLFSHTGERSPGPFTLAALVEGSTTAYTRPDLAIPRLKLVVIGTSYFADPQIPNPPGNALFLLSLAQWITQERNFLNIPAKDAPFRPLKPVADWVRRAAKFYGYFFTPALVAAAGFFHWRRRQNLRGSLQRLYQNGANPPAAHPAAGS